MFIYVYGCYGLFMFNHLWQVVMVYLCLFHRLSKLLRFVLIKNGTLLLPCFPGKVFLSVVRSHICIPTQFFAPPVFPVHHETHMWNAQLLHVVTLTYPLLVSKKLYNKHPKVIA